MNLTQYPLWNCPKKIEAREQSIILSYREFFNRQSIPKDKQYWTMCGSYDDHKGSPIKGEFHQLEKAGLISSNQFHAVDINLTIIEQNKKHYPKLNWYQGDFLKKMKNQCISGSFNPAIVNCDNVRLIGQGVPYLVSLLMFLEHNSDNVMVVSNLMLNHPYHKSIISSGNDIIHKLIEFYNYSEKWKLFPYYYKYKGTGTKAKTWMGTLLFIKK